MGYGVAMVYHRIATDRISRAPIRPWPVGMRSTAMQGHSEVMSQGWAIGWNMVHHRIAQHEDSGTPINRGTGALSVADGVVGDHVP